MTTVAVCKTGLGVITFPDENRLLRPTAEQGATVALLRHLCGRYRTVLVGRFRGTPPPELEVVEPEIPRGFTQDCPPEVHDRIIEGVRQRLESYDASCLVNMTGGRPSCCTASNPRGVRVLDYALRNVGPLLAPAAQLGLRRIACIADVRCYPQEQEMVERWEAMTPAALLGEMDRDWRFRLAGRRWAGREVWSRMETWLPEPDLRGPAPDRDIPLLNASHCHVRDGFGAASRAHAECREAVWRALLPFPDGTVTVGEGWEAMGMHDVSSMPPPECRATMRRAVCGLSVSPTCLGPYVTTKLRFYAQHGCAPVLYGRGEPMTQDGAFRYVPQDSPWRVTTSAELADVVRRAVADKKAARAWAEEVEFMTRPNYAVVEDAIRRCAASAPLDDDWWNDLGGYQCLERHVEVSCT